MTFQNHTSYLALPPSGKGPGVLVLHAWWGLNGFMRELCDRLAQEGFVALAPDLFTGKTAQTPDEAELLVARSNEGENVPPLLLSKVEELGQHPAVSAGGLGVLGFSFGAYWALWLAQQKIERIRAVTLFYGTNGGEGDFGQSRAAFLGHFAANDPFEPLESVKEMEKVLQNAGRPAAFYTYAGAGHWFFERDRPEAYQAQAAQLAWRRTLTFLRDHLE